MEALEALKAGSFLDFQDRFRAFLGRRFYRFEWITFREP
jgi:hypothetical protein